MTKGDIFGIGGIVAGLSMGIGLICKATSVENDKERKFAETVMQHPEEYKVYQDVEKYQMLENERNILRNENHSLRNQLSTRNDEYRSCMKDLNKYLDSELYDIRERQKKVHKYLGINDDETND